MLTVGDIKRFAFQSTKHSVYTKVESCYTPRVYYYLGYYFYTFVVISYSIPKAILKPSTILLSIVLECPPLPEMTVAFFDCKNCISESVSFPT